MMRIARSNRSGSRAAGQYAHSLNEHLTIVETHNRPTLFPTREQGESKHSHFTRAMHLQYEERRRQQMLQEQGVPAAQATQVPQTSTATEEEKPVKIDPRRFQCDTWVVSPNIRFLDKVSSSRLKCAMHVVSIATM